MTPKKLSSILIVSAIFFGATLAQAATYKTKLTLSVANANQSDETYELEVPGETPITASGWTSLGNITAKYKGSTPNFDKSKKLVVTVTSSNDFKLAASGITDTVTYFVATSENDTSETTTFEFSAAEINASGGTSKPIGVNVTDWSGLNLSAGEYVDEITYTATVEDDAPAGKTVDLATLAANYEAQNGDILTGTLAGNYKITIAEGASITLRDLTINGVHNKGYKWAGITPLGDATITLEGTNSVKGFHENYPGIFAAVGHTLTIKGTGSLNVSSNGYATGIGGGHNVSCGNITISGGSITATGGAAAAGIGGGFMGTCGNITISGDSITATGGTYAAGIGGGGGGSCSNITIASTVTKVTATKGNSTPNSIGAGGNGGTCGTVTIGGTVGAISDSPYTYQPSNG